MGRERTLTGEWSEDEEHVTGPVNVTCPMHQAHAVDLALLKQRALDMKEEIADMVRDRKDEHAAVMRSIDDHRRATAETFERQKAALEEIRLSASKVGAKVGLLWAGAGAAGGALMSLILKGYGG